MRNIYDLAYQGRRLLPEAEKMTRAELLKLLFSVGWKGSGTQQLSQLAEDAFYFGVSVGRKEQEPMSEELRAITAELQEKPELMRVLTAFSSLPEDQQPAALEKVLVLLQHNAQ